MSDIVAFIRARLDEDEMWARGANRPYEHADEGSEAPPEGVHWTWVRGENWDPTSPDPMVDEFVAEPGETCNLATVEQWPSSSGHRVWMMPRTYADSIVEMDAAAAGHIARHDPARVLAEVDAKRRIVDQYVETLDNARQHKGDLPLAGASLALLGVVKSLASAYADHPDYSPENWRFG